MSRSRQQGYGGFGPGFGRVSRTERQQADLFLADLFGRPARRRLAATDRPWRDPVAAPAPEPLPVRATASWMRPDLIFDHHAHLAPQEAEAVMGELADEGWTVVASPRSDTPLANLRENDVVVTRGMGDGRLAFVRVLGQDVEARTLYGRGGLIREDTLVLRRVGEGYEAPEVEDVEDVTPPAAPTDSGEATVHLPLLLAHAARGFDYDVSGPNCVLRWARVPRNFSGGLDVVVHFHGYKAHNGMRLAAKANASGLDLDSPGLTRPVLGLVPHGRAFASRIPNTDGFDFPAIASREALQRFIDAGLAAFKQSTGSADRTLTAQRVVLTGHSGGGAALNRLMRSVGGGEGVHAFHYFDATYGGTSAFIDERNGWLIAALRRDVQGLQGISGDAERARAMRERGGGLRILFIEGTPTASTAHAADRFIADKLRELASDEGLRLFLRRYYRAQRVANPRTVDHNKVPKTFGGRLLADGAHNLDPDAHDLIAVRVPAEDSSTPTSSWSSAPTSTPTPAPTTAPPPARTAPATADGTALERVRAAIDATLQSFRNVRVSVPAPTGRDLAGQVPYFINKPTSPSRLRGEERRPALVRNEALSRLYRALPSRAKVGKAYAADVLTFLQGALDAGAVPGQSSGVSEAALKAFLSDMGVGVDCSGFVSQALDACMTALSRSERINTNSANLRGGTGHNDRQFEVVNRPRDLTPGDTMWKTGHIRIIHRVEPQPDGSVQFVTAESSSVELVGPVAKTWKCPHADRFEALQVERAGTFRANSEVNVFSRYRPLAEALRGGRPAETAEGSFGSVPSSAPSSSRSSPAPPPPSPPPAPAPAPAPAPSGGGAVVPQTFTQPEVDRLAAIEFANAADIDAFCSRRGAAGFVGWFNSTWGGRPPFQRGNGGPIRMGTSAPVQQRFTAFWNSIPVAYDRPRINALDFAGLMCIVLNETGGDFGAHPERCGRGRSDARGPHPGLAYAFDRVIDVKASYNTLSGNRRAGDLFNDADYIRAHGTLGGAARLANHGGDFGGAWNSEYYPQADFSTAEDLTENGFIMQADFYKYRGRGVIQTTSRGAYLAAVSYVQAYSGSNTVLSDFKQRWTGLSRDVAATVSTNADWDLIFAQGEMLARAVRLHSGTGNSDYLTMSTQASVLLDVPARPARGVPRGTRGSIFFMGRRISGRYSYAAGPYRDRVLGMLNAMLAL